MQVLLVVETVFGSENLQCVVNSTPIWKKVLAYAWYSHRYHPTPGHTPEGFVLLDVLFHTPGYTQTFPHPGTLYTDDTKIALNIYLCELEEPGVYILCLLVPSLSQVCSII